MSDSPTNDELACEDAVGLADRIRSGDLSPVEAVQTTIDRIERLDGDLNAVIHRQFEDALALAASPDLPYGPFRGVPMLLKDLWTEEAGRPHHAGIKALKDADHRSTIDSNLVIRYREAGFVNVGRTNTPELGLVATTEPHAYGPTRNPWNTDFGTGGSSGGSAAAVASGMLPAANASDGGGSIRIPAAMCGLVGLKPSRGRVSMGPVKEEWGVSVQHVVCHTMRDTAAILDATAIPFLGDGVVAPDQGRPYTDQVGSDPGNLRIGFMDHSPRTAVHPDCAESTRHTASMLEGLGHHVDQTHPPALDQIDELGWAFNVNWGVGAVLSLEHLGGQLGRVVVEDDVEPGTWFLAERGRGVSAVDYAKAQGIMGTFRRTMAGWWESGYDLLVTPTTALPPPRIGELTPSEDDPVRGSKGSMPYAVFTSPFNTTGQPAISLPLGSSDGLPVGVQLVGAYGREDLLIAVGSQLEAVARWSDHRAPIHA
ncbi:MAG: amidase [Actinobacteria bacterium]|nr:amidase [Actinomycetota bacterium]